MSRIHAAEIVDAQRAARKSIASAHADAERQLAGERAKMQRHFDEQMADMLQKVEALARDAEARIRRAVIAEKAATERLHAVESELRCCKSVGVQDVKASTERHVARERGLEEELLGAATRIRDMEHADELGQRSLQMRDVIAKERQIVQEKVRQ